MGTGGGNKKNSIFKNIMIVIGCVVFAGLYCFAGYYVVNLVINNDGKNAVPAWLDKVEVHVDEGAENASGQPKSSDEKIVKGQESSKDIFDSKTENKNEEYSNGGAQNGSDKDSDSNNIKQKPRFKDEEKETEENTELEETEESTESESSTENTPEEQSASETETERTEEQNKRESRKAPVEVKHVEVISQAGTAKAVVADVTAVVQAAMPCVVSITNEYTAYDYWYDEEVDDEVNGSGIIVSQSDEELLIVTNYHVIEDSNNLYVQFIDDAEAVAYVKGVSPENDLAIVSVFLEDMTNDTLDYIAIAALGDSDRLQVGEPAIAIGNSLGYGQSVTTGVISALNRDIFAEDPDINQGYLIQTDAAINPGNSGGALLNVNGEVVGINSSKIADYVIEGMGYAIPISTAKPIIDDLMLKETKKKVPVSERAFLGVSGTDVTEDAISRYDMPEGVYVTGVMEDTAAEKAGLVKGDIITYIDGEKVSQMEELQNMLVYYAAGTEIELKLMRQTEGEYKELILHITLEHK